MDKPVKRMVQPVKWTEKFFECTPLVDEYGEPVPQNKQVNISEYWDAPRSTASILQKSIKKQYRDVS